MSQVKEAGGDVLPGSSSEGKSGASDDRSIERTETTTTTPPQSDEQTQFMSSCKSDDKHQVDTEEAQKNEHKSIQLELATLRTKLDSVNNELEREVQRRCDLEQRFSEEAKRSTDQIEELIAKSDQDDARIGELRKRFDLYSRETASMIESFTTNREILTSQLLELRQENDYLLGKYIGKSRDLQNSEINLPQTVEELQFHCLTLNEKLILATLAKEQLETTLMQSTATNN